MASLAGKVITVTGAASGMGKAVARLVSSRGARIAIADIQKRPLEELTEELQSSGVDVKATVVDIGSHTEVDEWISDSVKYFGRLDGSANIAGILPREQMFAEQDNDVWDRVLRTNLYGTMHCVRAQLRAMKRGASIVNFASVLGTHSQAGLTVYSISKHGVVALTKSVAKEAGKDGIRINAVAPGAMDTPMTGGLLKPDSPFLQSGIIPLVRFGQPDDAARLTVFLLSDESNYMHGHVTYVDGGFVC